MAIKNVFELHVDLKRSSNQTTMPTIVQNDSVQFIINLSDNGKPLSEEQLQEVSQVSLANVRKDRSVVVTPGTLEGSKAIFDLGTNETELGGHVKAVVQLYDSEDRVTTISFSYSVVADPTGKDYVPSEKEQTLIEVVMAEAQAKIDELSQVDVVDLKAKQDEFTVQLAQKATKGQIISSDLSTATDVGKIKLVNLADEVQQALTGNAPALSVIPKGSVTIEKTGFFNVSRQNLYNPATATFGFIDSNNGAVLSNTSYKTSDFIPVTPNAQYWMSLNYNLAFYDANKTFVSGVGGGWGTSLPVAERYVLNVPNNSNIKYVRVTANSNDSTFMFVEGAIKPASYIPYGTYSVVVSDQPLADEIKKLAKQVVDDADYNFPKQSINIDAIETFEVELINLANPAEFEADNTFVNSSNGSITTLSGYVASGFIQVEPNTNYRISHTNDYAWYDENKLFISGRGGGWSQSPVTSPTNAKYLRASFTMAYGIKMVVKGDVLPTAHIPYDSPENRVFSFASDDWKSKFSKALGVSSSRISQKKWNVLGDSITYGVAADGCPYHKWIADRTGITVTNYGISMSTVSDMVGNPQGYDPASYNPMIYRYQNMTDDADIITVMAGTNDILHGAPLGVFGNTDTNTFYGALDILIKGLINKYPTKSIGYILPPFASPELDPSKKYETFTKAIKEVCKYYGIPVLDLYTGNQLGGRVTARKDLFIPDGVHPSKAGHEKLSFAVEQFLLSI